MWLAHVKGINMQNAEFHCLLSISCYRNLVRNTLANKEYNHKNKIIIMQLIDEQDFLYMVAKQNY